MELDLYLFQQTRDDLWRLLEKKVSGLRDSAGSSAQVRRAWLTRGESGPVLSGASAFDFLIAPVRLGPSEMEDYRVCVGQDPKTTVRCVDVADTTRTCELLWFIVVDAMAALDAAGLCPRIRIDEDILQRMGGDKGLSLDDFPGSVYEVAHERSDGLLVMEWLADTRWVKSWLGLTRKNEGPASKVSRFATLDYQ